MEIPWSELQQEAQDAAVLPDGDYPCIVTKSEATQSSTQKPMIKVTLRVTSGPKKDRPVYTQFVLSRENPMALRMWFLNMAAFGLGPDYFATNPTMEKLASDLLNRGVLITLDSREWQGQTRNNVKALKAFPSDGPPPPGLVVGLPQAGPSSVTTPAPAPAAAPTPSGAAPSVGTLPPPPKPF